MNPLTHLKQTILPLVASFVLGCFGLLPAVQAVVPAPDGCYPNYTTAEGCNALMLLTTGVGNTAVGWVSLGRVTTGNLNTAVGAGTLVLNNSDRNTAIGAGALLRNNQGVLNTATGAFALLFNTIGGLNTANGDSALAGNIDGFDNTASGVNALVVNTSGDANTADGRDTLFHNTTGSDNTAVGHEAGFNATTGDGNVYIGAGMQGVADEESHTYIRNINVTSVSGAATDTVTVDLATGLLGHATSSRRYKEDIRPMENASQALYRLHPVTFRYNKDIDRTQSRAFGLIAEEVAEVNPDLIARNSQGEPESVHYEAVNAMLLNEFLKEHRKVEELQATVAQQRKDSEATAAQQQKEIEALTATLKAQASEIQKVRAQLEVNKPAPRTVLNNQ